MKPSNIWLIAAALVMTACAAPQNDFFVHADQWYQTAVVRAR